MTTALLDRANPLWQGLDDAGAARVAQLFVQAEFAPGERLIRQGPRSDAAFIVETGDVQVVRELPGGRTIPLDEMGPGAVIGELGLLADAQRLASVIARGQVKAQKLTASAFQAGAEALDPAMLTVARNLLGVMGRRLADQSARIADTSTAKILGGHAASPPPALDIEAFDWRGFAPILPAFAAFAAPEMTAFLAALKAESLPKGAMFIPAGTVAERASFVIRGAAAATYEIDGQSHGLNVLGPGELCAASFLIERQPADLTYVAREPLILASMPIDDFHTMLHRDDALGLALIKTAAWSLSRGFARSNNLLGNAARLARAGRA